MREKRSREQILQSKREYFKLNREKYLPAKRLNNRLTASRFTSLRAVAKRRNLTVELTLEEYKRLLDRNECHYCSGPLPETGAGLDRVDSKYGYSVSNCVPCCKVCNQTKSDYFTYKEMLQLGALIKDIYAQRKNNG